MTLSDSIMMDWVRRRAGNGITQRDVDLCGDVYSLIPLLYIIPRYTVRGAGNPIYVEIGTADGSTALPILKAAEETNGFLYSVDPSECEDAHRLVDTFGYRNFWSHKRMKSDDFFKEFNSPIAFTFIDGDHSWPQVARDIKNSYKLLEPGGIIFLSDYDAVYSYMINQTYFDGDNNSKEGYEKNCIRGIAKAIIKVLPSLQNCTMTPIMLSPNPSILIRKTLEGEVFKYENRFT